MKHFSQVFKWAAQRKGEKLDTEDFSGLCKLQELQSFVRELLDHVAASMQVCFSLSSLSLSLSLFSFDVYFSFKNIYLFIIYLFFSKKSLKN